MYVLLLLTGVKYLAAVVPYEEVVHIILFIKVLLQTLFAQT